MNIGGNINSIQQLSNCSKHPIDPSFFSFGEGEGSCFFGGFMFFTNVFPSSSQCFLSMFLKLSMCSPNIFPIASHFVPYDLPKTCPLGNLYSNSHKALPKKKICSVCEGQLTSINLPHVSCMFIPMFWEPLLAVPFKARDIVWRIIIELL